VDTRSDIYSLGVLLYELLTGTTPFDQETFRTAGYDEIRRIIREQEPPKPSTRLRKDEGGRMKDESKATNQTGWGRLLSFSSFILHPSSFQELDWIVMKCLEKDRNRRYETANSLVADLRRHLNHEPVTAGPPSPWYRLRKAARRNRVILATASAVAVASVLYAIDRSRATVRIIGLANDLGKERESLKISLAQSNRLLAIRDFERGQAAFEKGEIGPGMLWMIESWRLALEAGETAWQRAARVNLAAWRPHYPRLKAVLSHSMAIREFGAIFSPDGRTVFSCSFDGTAQLWDVASAKKIGPPLELGPGGGFVRMVLGPDGKRLLTCSPGNTCQLWDAANGKALGSPLRLPPQIQVQAAAGLPNGNFVLVGYAERTDNVVPFWDAATGKPVGPTLTHQALVYPPVFSPDGQIILTPSEDGMVRLCYAATGRPIGQPLKHPGGFQVAVFSPDGKAVLTGGGTGDGTAQVWDAATRQPIGQPMRHESSLNAAAFSPDGKTVLTGCQDKNARLWDAATGQLIGLLEHQGSVIAVAFSPDKKTMLTGSLDGTVRLWDARPGQPVGQMVEIPSTDAFSPDDGLSPDGKVFVSRGRGYVQLWDATTRQPIGGRIPQPGGNYQALFSLDGKVLLTTTIDQMARLWDATTGVALGPALSIPSKPDGQRLSPDGKALLFVDRDKTVWICDGATGRIRGHTPIMDGDVNGFAFSPDGKTFLTALYNGEVRLWDAATLTPLGLPFPRHPGGIGHGQFSRDGKSILITSEDGSCWVWDVATRKLLMPGRRHQAPVYGTAFSHDGRTIATGSEDKTVQIWDIATGQPIGPVLRHNGPVRLVAFLDDGKTLYTRDAKGSRLFLIPLDLPDDLERVSVWVETITGLRLDNQQGVIEVLDNKAWLEQRERLTQLGGPPETGPEQRLDPILFGPDPTARARSLMERKQWESAEAAFDEAMRARPFNIAIVVERGDLYARRGLWSEAVAYYASKIKQYPEVAPLYERLAVTRLLSGDRPGYRAACAEMAERFKPIDDSKAAVRIAYACSLAAEAICDFPDLIEASNRPTRSIAANDRIVGAVLFRAGRLDEALERFERARKVFQPRAWDLLFLAMIHGRLGRLSEARRLLEQADRWITEADQSPSGMEQESPRWNDSTEKPIILLLRREAEAAILDDSVFPADPLAGR
jgi:WD40 repeat protein/tetratricopeptide (TPR) repeat protein